MMHQKLSPELSHAVELLRGAELNTEAGMPEELFLLVSGLIPLVNVDLLVINDAGQVLLARRNDGFFDKSWHIPGGCIRYLETLQERLRETAQGELGPAISAAIHFEQQPAAVRDVIRGLHEGQVHPRERGHNVAILYRGYVSGDIELPNKGLTEADNGYLKWFDRLPDDFLKIQTVYSDILTPWL